MDFAPLPLLTPRLRLRPVAAADAADLYAIFSDPQTLRYWSSPPWVSMDQAYLSIARDEAALAAGEAIRLGLERLSDGRVIGVCSLFSLSPQNRRAEIGYALARDAWGQGWMDEALRALVAHAFGPLGLHRLEADIDPRNAASARALQRLGFREEGRLRERWIVAGEVSDSGLWGLLARDWAARP